MRTLAALGLVAFLGCSSSPAEKRAEAIALQRSMQPPLEDLCECGHADRRHGNGSGPCLENDGCDEFMPRLCRGSETCAKCRQLGRGIRGHWY